MTRFGKSLLVAVAVCYAMAFGVAAVFVYRVVHSGTAVVSVHEKRPHGTHLWLPIPLGLVHTAAAFVPADELPPIGPEAKRYLPVIREAVAALEQAPDGVLVDVTSADEHVVLAKKDNRFTIDVDAKGETVHVSLPAGALSMLAGDLERFPAFGRHGSHWGPGRANEI
jgi:hypothetical protein